MALFVAGSVYAGNGKQVFTASGCAACHHPTKDQTAMGLGPSLKQITKAYKGNKGQLTKFLKGKAAPKIDKKKFNMLMKSQLAMTKRMPAAKLKALVDFIASHK